MSGQCSVCGRTGCVEAAHGRAPVSVLDKLAGEACGGPGPGLLHRDELAKMLNQARAERDEAREVLRGIAAGRCCCSWMAIGDARERTYHCPACRARRVLGEVGETCGCGRPVRYETSTGPACNKYARCAGEEG